MSVGILFSIFDGDAKHFDRFEAELNWLETPYAVNFDHCCRETVVRFGHNPLCAGYYCNTDPDDFFDESHRQRALEILIKLGFDWALSLDVDETLEPLAWRKIDHLTEKFTMVDPNPPHNRVRPDVVDVKVLDLWGDEDHYRVDGTFANSHREKLFNLKSGEGEYFRYTHPTIHAPKLHTELERQARIVHGYPLYVLHWGIMDMEDVKDHTKRWDDIYTRKVGGNPYGFYPYINDPKTNPPSVASVQERLAAEWNP